MNPPQPSGHLPGAWNAAQWLKTVLTQDMAEWVDLTTRDQRILASRIRLTEGHLAAIRMYETADRDHGPTCNGAEPLHTLADVIEIMTYIHSDRPGYKPWHEWDDEPSPLPDEVSDPIDQFLADPSTGVRRSRPTQNVKIRTPAEAYATLNTGDLLVDADGDLIRADRIGLSLWLDRFAIAQSESIGPDHIHHQPSSPEAESPSLIPFPLTRVHIVVDDEPDHTT